MSRRNRPNPDQDDRTASAAEAADEAPSKTVRKKQAQALQDLGLALARLPEQYRRAVDMPEDLREAVDSYLKTRSHEGRRRQLQFVGKLLRRVDPAPLSEAVDRFASGRSADAERLHAIERWRDALITDDEAVTRWVETYPDTDIQQLRSLVLTARREAAGSDPEQRQPKSYRQLFRLIRSRLETADPG